MTKTKKELVKNMVDNKNEDLFKVKVEQVAKQIQVLLEENELGLQPFLQTSAFGIVPQVRLVSTSKENEEK